MRFTKFWVALSWCTLLTIVGCGGDPTPIQDTTPTTLESSEAKEFLDQHPDVVEDQQEVRAKSESRQDDATAQVAGDSPQDVEGQPSDRPVDEPSVAPVFSDEALRNAAAKGNLSTVRKAIESGSDVNATDADGRTALQLAAFDGHADVIEFLLQHEAKVGHRDAAGRTALMYASTGPHGKTVKMLLDAGAETNLIDNGEGFTALMFAAAEGQVEVVRLLLDSKANPAIADVDGDTAKDFAAKNGHDSVVKLLGD